MKTGTVKWFNKSYGFIIQEDGSEIFVHYKNIKMNGFRTLKQDQKVTYEIGDAENGRTQAINVKPVEVAA